MTTLSPSKNSYHIIGIAGSGMNAIAQTLRAKGFGVTGSDRYHDQGKDLPIFKTLQDLDITLFPQDGTGIKKQTAAIIVSTAIEGDNPDIATARSLNIPILHRSQILAQMIEGSTCIAVAGTSGKTTVTGMLGWLFEKAGKDPFVVNGGAIPAWEAKNRTGHIRSSSKINPIWIIEADESDRSFLRYNVDTAIITNISEDHFSLKDSIDLFQQFANEVGHKIICTPQVAEQLGPTLLEKLIVVPDHLIQQTEKGWSFLLDGKRCSVPQPGHHNAINAALAAQVAKEYGCSPYSIQQALACFPGIRRRLEVKANINDILVVDDMAHNPEKITAAWTAMKENKRRVLGVWRPHGFTPLKALYNRLLEAFSHLVEKEDHLYILPVYYAGGTTQRETSSSDLVSSLQHAGVNATYVDGYEQLLTAIQGNIAPDTCVLAMGARDPELTVFCEKVAQRLTNKSH